MLLSELGFGAFLCYSPRGETQEILWSRRIRDALKSDRLILDPPRPTTRALAEYLANVIGGTPLEGFLGPDAALVPAPRSSRLVRGGLWVPHRIAEALVDVGLGGSVMACLERVEPVQKAAYASAEARPRARDHYRTIVVGRALARPERIVVVDDIVTRGATLLGAASRLAEAFPGVDVKGFALVRTISNPEEFQRVESPVVGRIELRRDETFRRP